MHGISYSILIYTYVTGTAADFKSWIKEYMNAVVLKLREKGNYKYSVTYITPAFYIYLICTYILTGKSKEEIQAFKATAPGM